MAITTQTVKVDLNTGKVLPVVYAHQNDTNRAIQFEVYNENAPFLLSGYTVKFGYVSPKINGAYTVIAGDDMASGSVSGNIVTFNIPESYLAIAGDGLLTMIISGTGSSIRPVNIRFAVQTSADGSDVMAGASDFPDAWMDEKIYSWLDDHIDGIFTEEQFTDAVDAWLDDHPEATTTVQDGSITYAKLNSNINSGFVLDNGTYKYDYNGLVNKPESDETLSVDGGFADAKAVGDAVNKLSIPDLVDSLDFVRFPFVSFKKEDSYYATQGMCVADGYLIVTRFQDDALTAKYYAIDIETRTVVNTAEYITGHSNCLAYAEGNIYCADGTTLYIIPFSNGTFGTMGTATIPNASTGIAYNSNERKMYFRMSGVDGVRAIYEASLDDLTAFSHLCDISDPISNQTPQGFGFDGNYIVHPMSGGDYVERIFIYTTDGEFVKAFEIPRKTFTEIEDVDFYDGYIFINFNGGSSYGSYMMCVPYLVNAEPKNFSKPFNAKKIIYSDERLSLSLDNTNTVAFPDWSNPFNTPTSALLCIGLIQAPTDLNVSGEYGTLSVIGINASSLKIILNDANITNLNIINCGNLILSGSGTIKTLKVENGNCYFVSGSSIKFVGTDNTSDHAIQIYRAMATGTLGTITNYLYGVRALQSIVNLSIGEMTDVTTAVSKVNSLVYVNGSAL